MTWYLQAIGTTSLLSAKIPNTKVTVNVIKNDITEHATDAIVSASNTELELLSGGVSGSISEKGMSLNWISPENWQCVSPTLCEKLWTPTNNKVKLYSIISCLMTYCYYIQILSLRLLGSTYCHYYFQRKYFTFRRISYPTRNVNPAKKSRRWTGRWPGSHNVCRELTL